MTGLLALALAGCGDRQAPAERDRVLRFERRELLERPPGNQLTANVRHAPLGLDDATELVVSEINPPRITLVGCGPRGCNSRELAVPRGLVPTRSATADLDGDGDQDLIFASVGKLRPTNERVGSIWVLWRDGARFSGERIAHDMGRACCAEPGDLDGDGDLDLAVCAFGHETVGVLGWLEQEDGAWVQHVVDPQPGAIHAFPVDVDADGDLDLLAAFAQLEEAVHLYRNDGVGGFTRETVYDRPETWWGLSGIEPVDLDQDGDVDLLLTHGDTMDGDFPEDLSPPDVHGVDWLENDGTGAFTLHELHRVWGAYTVRAADLDGDRDLDVVVGTMQMADDWPDLPERRLVVLLNDGAQRFEAFDLPNAPPQIVSIEVGDLDGDGQIDIAMGSLEFQPDSSTVRLDALFQRTR